MGNELRCLRWAHTGSPQLSVDMASTAQSGIPTRHSDDTMVTDECWSKKHSREWNLGEGSSELDAIHPFWTMKNSLLPWCWVTRTFNVFPNIPVVFWIVSKYYRKYWRNDLGGEYFQEDYWCKWFCHTIWKILISTWFLPLGAFGVWGHTVSGQGDE